MSFNSFKSNINTCTNCGAVYFDFSETCMNCGLDLQNISRSNQFNEKPCESTIEVKAEEIK